MKKGGSRLRASSDNGCRVSEGIFGCCFCSFVSPQLLFAFQYCVKTKVCLRSVRDRTGCKWQRQIHKREDKINPKNTAGCGGVSHVEAAKNKYQEEAYGGCVAVTSAGGTQLCANPAVLVPASQWKCIEWSRVSWCRLVNLRLYFIGPANSVYWKSKSSFFH